MKESTATPYALVVEDHALVADSLSEHLRTFCPALGTVTAPSLARALAVMLERRSAPVLIVSDLNLTDAAGIEVLRSLRQAAPESRLLVLTASDSPELRREAASAHVFAYVVKTTSMQRLRAILSQALTNLEDVLAPLPYHTEHPRAISNTNTNTGKLADILTSRQLEVLQELAMGCSNKEIAMHLGLSGDTVGTHMKEILGRLGVRNRTQAVVRYLDLGGTPLVAGD